MATTPKRVYMRDLAKELDRSSHTVRCWERDGMLPKSLRPRRDDKGWRYWTPSQVVRIKRWMERNGMAPGKGLRGFNPSNARVQEVLTQLRKPRDIELRPCPICRHNFKNVASHMRRAHPATAATS